MLANTIVLRSFVDPDVDREYEEVDGYVDKAVVRWSEVFMPIGFPCTLYDFQLIYI
jgi:hypothetical protein